MYAHKIVHIKLYYIRPFPVDMSPKGLNYAKWVLSTGGGGAQ